MSTDFDADAFWGTPPTSCTTTTNTTKTRQRGSGNSSHGNSSPREKSMSGASLTCAPATSKGSPSATSSQESADGPALSSLQDGPRTNRSGPCHARASHFPQQAKGQEPQTKDTSGLSPLNSSASADLQSCSENKSPLLSSLARSNDLSARMGKILQRRLLSGSMEYSLTWSQRTTPAGRLLWQQRASAHRTSGSGCTGWPTTKAKDGREWSPNAPPGSSSGHGLGAVAQMAGWATPDTCAGGTGPSQTDRNSMRLQDQVLGWTTPNARDWKDMASPEVLIRAMDGAKGSANLPRQAATISGPDTNSSPAGTAKRGALNPALSRWLMGYPVEWCQSALQAFRTLKQQGKRGSPGSRDMETPSSRKSPRSSSSPPKKLGTTELENFWE